MRKPINVTIEKFVQHKTAQWQGIVFNDGNKRFVTTRFNCWELTDSREAALDTIVEITDFPKFVGDLNERYASNPIIPVVPYDLIKQLDTMVASA